jgi:dTDP-4-dehydrorhamnose reductase
VIITGGAGLLGLNWGYYLPDRYTPVLGLHSRQIRPKGIDAQSLSLDSTERFLADIDGLDPALVIHAAGLTSIERCEKDPALARYVNVELTRHVCEACKKLQIPMVHISTDNLFDGTTPMVDESHTVNPVNMYGKTKANAEQEILSSYSDVIIVRTNFYGSGPVYKPSFSDTIIGTLRKGGTLSLFEDVYYTPILMSDLIHATHDLLDQGYRGVFHIVGDERLSKLEFGYKIAKQFKLDQKLIHVGKLADIPNLTKRPFDMSLSNKKTCKALGKKIGSVNEQLATLSNQDNTEVNITLKRSSK